MSYKLVTFGSVPLPTGMQEDDLSTAAADSTLVATIGNFFDMYGTRRRLPRTQQLTTRGMYTGQITYIIDHSSNNIVDHSGNLLIAGDAANQLRAQEDNLRAKVGVSDSLWRQRDDAVLQWRTARLLQVTRTGTVQDWASVSSQLDCNFESSMGLWRSATATTSTRTLAANATTGAVVNVHGQAVVEDPIITITATSAITSINLAVAALGVSWTWTGTLAAGAALVVNCGAATILNAGANAYSGFVLGSGHTAYGWLPLAVGTNNLLLTIVGGGGSLSLSHYNKWL